MQKSKVCNRCNLLHRSKAAKQSCRKAFQQTAKTDTSSQVFIQVDEWLQQYVDQQITLKQLDQNLKNKQLPGAKAFLSKIIKQEQILTEKMEVVALDIRQKSQLPHARILLNLLVSSLGNDFPFLKSVCNALIDGYKLAYDLTYNQIIEEKIDNLEAKFIEEKMGIQQYFQNIINNLAIQKKTLSEINKRLMFEHTRLLHFKEHILNKQHKSADIDSILLFTNPSILPWLVGARALLSSSTERLNDQVSNQWLDLLQGPFTIRIPFEHKQDFKDCLFKQKIQFQYCDNLEKRISRKKTYVSTYSIMSICKQLGIQKIRLMGHGLKQKYLFSFPFENYIIPDQQNRIDVAISKDSDGIALFSNCNNEVYPMLGRHCQGSLKVNYRQKIKIYPTIIHSLKKRINIATRISSKKSYYQINNILRKLSQFLQMFQVEEYVPQVRFQKSIFLNKPSNFTKLAKQTIQQLEQIDLRPSSQVPLEEYAQNIKNFLLQCQNRKIFSKRGSKVASQLAIRAVKHLLGLFGYSEHPIKKCDCRLINKFNFGRSLLKTKRILKRKT